MVTADVDRKDVDTSPDSLPGTQNKMIGGVSQDLIIGKNFTILSQTGLCNSLYLMLHGRIGQQNN